MSEPAPSPPRPGLAPAALLSTLLLFLAVRAALAFARDPFFDELFTVWISVRPFAQILKALLLDSGPPLYYALIHAVFSMTGPSIEVARAASVAIAACGLVAVASSKRLGEERWIAALLLSVLPAHVYFSTEARAYVLCGTLVGFAVLALERWSDGGQRKWLAGSVAAIVLAAYAHYYGVLFFPLPLVVSLLAVRKRPRGMAEGAAAAAVCGVLYLPGFWLALRQPAFDAMRWMAIGDHVIRWKDVLSSFWRLGMAGPLPEQFMLPPPKWMQFASVVLTAAILLFRTWGSRRALVFALSVITPMGIAICFYAAGRNVYFPLRFEAVLAIPFVLWLAAAVERSGRWVRPVALVLLLTAGAAVSIVTIAEAARRPADHYRSAAEFARRSFDPRKPVVTTGFGYLEVVSQRDRVWQPRVIPLPAEQGEHPGWRVLNEGDENLRREIEAIDRESGGEFFFVSETASPELRTIGETHALRALFRSEPAIAGIATRRVPLQ